MEVGGEQIGVVGGLENKVPYPDIQRGSRGVNGTRSNEILICSIQFRVWKQKEIDLRRRRFPSGNTGKASVTRSGFKSSSGDRRISPQLGKSHLTL